jgi:predicted P-loop ATPase
MISSGRRNRAKLLYRLDTPLASKKVVEARQNIVDFRCATATGETAQDVLPPSSHPDTGKPYEWKYGDDLVADWRSLPEIPAALLALWQSLLTPGVANAVDAPRVGVEALRELLSHHDPDCDRDQWVKRLDAIHHDTEGGADGLELAIEWSSRGTKYKGRRDVETVWRSFHATGDRLITAASLRVEEAATADDFEVIEPPPSVKPLHLREGDRGPISDEENVLRIIERDPALTGIARFDELRSERILARPISSDSTVIGERGIPRPWTDADTVALQTYIQRTYIPRIGRERIEGPLDLYARQHGSFHPVRDYLQGLQWDGTLRLDTWLQAYVGACAQPEAYLAAVGAKFLISAVARILEPGCQVDSAMVLEGPQGIFKSTLLRVLASDEYFSDSLPADLTHKDARDHLRGKWIIELSELAQFKRGEIESIKAFLSRRTESYRPSYGRHEIHFPRQCVFAGTTNSSEYLIDPTGNRRFWVVACGMIDIDALRRDRDQLWAEATSRYNHGERWHLTGDIADVAASQAQARVAHDPWTDDVLRALGDIGLAEVAPGEVLRRMDLPQEARHERNAGRVGKILRELGWERVRRDRNRGQLFAGTPPNDVSSLH